MAEEERKAGVIKAELDMLRAVLLPEMDNKSIERKKRAAVERMSNNVIKREQMPLCPDISPDLLGPLMVDQSLTTMEKVDLNPVCSARSSMQMGHYWSSSKATFETSLIPTPQRYSCRSKSVQYHPCNFGQLRQGMPILQQEN